MSNRRVKLCFVVAVLLSIGVGGALLFTVDSAPLTRQCFERVEKGMSRDFVIQLIGRPPGNHTTGPFVTMPHGVRYRKYESWLCDDGQLLVHFDEKGIATDVVVCDLLMTEPRPIIERIRAILGI